MDASQENRSFHVPDSVGSGFQSLCSGEELRDKVSMDIGEAEVAALKAVGEPEVVEPQEMEQRGMEIVDVDFVFGDIEAEIIGFTESDAWFYSATSHPHTE